MRHNVCMWQSSEIRSVSWTFTNLLDLSLIHDSFGDESFTRPDELIMSNSLLVYLLKSMPVFAIGKIDFVRVGRLDCRTHTHMHARNLVQDRRKVIYENDENEWSLTDSHGTFSSTNEW